MGRLYLFLAIEQSLTSRQLDWRVGKIRQTLATLAKRWQKVDRLPDIAPHVDNRRERVRQGPSWPVVATATAPVLTPDPVAADLVGLSVPAHSSSPTSSPNTDHLTLRVLQCGERLRARRNSSG